MWIDRGSWKGWLFCALLIFSYSCERSNVLTSGWQELRVVSLDPAMHEILGWPSYLPSSEQYPTLPPTVHDLLPPDIRSMHRRCALPAPPNASGAILLPPAPEELIWGASRRQVGGEGHGGGRPAELADAPAAQRGAGAVRRRRGARRRVHRHHHQGEPPPPAPRGPPVPLPPSKRNRFGGSASGRYLWSLSPRSVSPLAASFSPPPPPPSLPPPVHPPTTAPASTGSWDRSWRRCQAAAPGGGRNHITMICLK